MREPRTADGQSPILFESDTTSGRRMVQAAEKASTTARNESGNTDDSEEIMDEGNTGATTRSGGYRCDELCDGR